MLAQELLKYFGVLATAWAGGDLGTELERVPTAVVVGAVDEAQRTFDETDRVNLYRLLAHDARPEVYSRLRKSLASDQRLSSLRLLAQDDDPEVQGIVVDALRMRLSRANLEERTRLATSFALATGSGPRLILARSLSGSVPGEVDYLYVLANDADPRVRRAAVEATRRLLSVPVNETTSDPQTLAAIGEVFETRLHDSEDGIRKQARRAYADVRARMG